MRALVVLAAALMLSLAARADALSIRDATIVDVDAGTAARGDVHVEGGVIAAVGPGLSAPGATVLEAGGRWLIPGLWDVHVHIFSDPAEADTTLPLYLLNGVTGIRDMGALLPVETQMALAAALEADDPLAALMSVMAGHTATVLETWDAARCRAVLAEMAGAGLHVSPTFVVAGFYLGLRPDPKAPRMRTLPAEVRAAWDAPDFRLEAMTDAIRALADRSIALDRRTFAMAVKAGVPILASTGASFANLWIFHGTSLPDELEIYVAAGMTPPAALFSATAAPPRFFGLADQDGRIAPGRRADLVLLDADPLADIAAVRAIAANVVRGRLLGRAALDGMRADLEAAAR